MCIYRSIAIFEEQKDCRNLFIMQDWQAPTVIAWSCPRLFLSNRVYSYICDKYTPLLWQSKGKRRIKIVEIFQLLSSCVWTLFTWTSLRLGLFRAFLCCGVTAFFTGPGLSALMSRIVRISFKVQFSSYIWTNQLQHNTITNDWWGSVKINNYLFEATRVRSSTKRLLKFWSSTSPKAL